MTPRTPHRIRPIPFAVPRPTHGSSPAAGAVAGSPPVAVPMASPLAASVALSGALPGIVSTSSQRRAAPAPIAWGVAEPAAASHRPVATAEDPRALYNVTRRWQGRATDGDDAPTAPSPTPQSHPPSGHAHASPSSHRSTGLSHGGELMARYTGQGSLCVRSSVTGRHYRFQGHGDTLRVDKHDLMLLKRIADLQLG